MKSGSTFDSSNGLIEQNPRLLPENGSRASGVLSRTRKMSRTADLGMWFGDPMSGFLGRTSKVLSTLRVVRDGLARV